MPEVIHVPDLVEGYTQVCQTVLNDGAISSPRGQMTRELLDVIIVLDNPRLALPIGVGRSLNVAIGAAEALQLIGGFAMHDVMPRIAPSFKQFLEDDGRFWGSYGDRIGMQVRSVLRKLKADPDSRQAVITLWDPQRDNVEAKRDYPCTVMMQFLVRDGSLVMHTTMRSNDVWWGLAYDAFQFTQLQLTIAHVLNLDVGPYHHHAVSLHAYERDWPKIRQLTPPTMTDEQLLRSLPQGITGSTWHHVEETCVRVAEQSPDPGASRSVLWYRDVLGEYL